MQVANALSTAPAASLIGRLLLVDLSKWQSMKRHWFGLTVLDIEFFKIVTFIFEESLKF
jgi:hypothetical protein